MADAGGLSRRPLTGDDGPWERLLEKTGSSTPFHTLAWRSAITSAFDYRPRYTVWEREGEPVAGLPLFETGRGIRRTLVNPFCEYSFPIVTEAVSVQAVAESLVDGRSRRQTIHVKEADWTGRVGYNAAGFGGVQTGTVRRLSTDAAAADRRRRYDRSLRRNLETAIDEGVVIRTRAGTCDSMAAFHTLHRRTVRRRGSPPFPRRFFESLAAEFGDRLTLYEAKGDGGPVAGLLTIDHDTTRHLYVNASDPAYWDVRPNDALYDRALADACTDSSITTVDFGRSHPGSGVDRFKAGFGGTSEPLTTLVSPPHRSRTADVRGWRRLEPVAKRLAPVITHPGIGPRLKEMIHE